MSFRFCIVFCLLTLVSSSVYSQSDSTLQARQLLMQSKQKLYVQPALALDQLEQALAMAKSDDRLTAEICKQLAILQLNSGKYKQAKEALLHGLGAADRSNSADLRADLLFLLGSGCHAQGDFGQAVEKYLEALRVFELRSNEVGKLNTYLALAELYGRQNNFTKAIEYNLQALRLLEQKGDRFRSLNIYEQLGSIYARMKQPARAAEYYRRAYRAFGDLKNPAGQTSSLINLAQAEFDQGDPARAMEHFTEARGLAAQLKAIPLEIRALVGSARCAVLLKQDAKAETAYRKVIQLAGKAGLKIELDEAYEGLAALFQRKNNQATASAYRSLSASIKDSLFNDSILRKTANLQLLYETEKKERQIERLSRLDEVKELELLQTRQVKNFFIAFSGLMVALIAVFGFFYRQNRKITKELKLTNSALVDKNQEIEAQKEQLTQLNQVKDRFFSIISHDLRNNLTTMKLYFDLVSNPAHQQQMNTSLSKEVAGSVQNTIDLLENLLVWASGQIKGVEVMPERISLHALAEENCQMLMSMAIQKQIKLTNETDEEAFIKADKNMVNLILRNLLSNALKFTPEGGSVNIVSQEEGEMHQILVIDNGVGIAPDKLETLFTAHQQVSTKGTGNEKGTGLGLMLCKEFVEKNGGRIWVESDEGKGSIFYFTFPKA